ncbi:MAG: hypothetical protein ACRD2T_12725 [Thermoanaerobaculia bacterium]
MSSTMSPRRTARTAVSLLVLLAASAAPLAAGVNRWTRIGPYGGVVTELATAASRPRLVYAALQGGNVFRSPDAGRSWAFAGGVPATRVEGLAVHPRVPALVYAATEDGLFRTTDTGASWVRVGGDPGRQAVVAVAIDPRSPRIVYAARFAGALSRSEDGGATWTDGDDGPHGVWSIAIDPTRSRTVYVTAQGGPFKSTDRGATWAPIHGGLPPGLPRGTIFLDPRRPTTLFLAISSYQGGLFRSTDAGATWRPSASGLGRGGVVALAFDSAGGPVYAATGLDGVFASTNGGVTWRPARAGLEGFLVWDLLATRFGLLAATLGQGVFSSSDRAATWQASNQGLTALVVTGMAVGDQNPPRLYAGDPEAGLFKTADRGAHWLRLKLDLALEGSELTGPVEVDPRLALTVYAGILGGFARSDNGGRRWQIFGLGCLRTGRIVLDPHEPGTVYVGGGFAIAACGLLPGACASFKVTPAGAACLRDAAIGPRGVAVLAADPHVSGHLYAAGHADGVWNLYQSFDGGASWSLLAPALLPHLLVFDPAQAGVVYGGFDGAVGRSADGGITWELSSEGLPESAAVISLALDPTDPAVLYAAAVEGVFKSTDGGRTWSDIAPGLAGLPVRKVLVDPQDPSILYAATRGASVLSVDQEP